MQINRYNKTKFSTQITKSLHGSILQKLHPPLNKSSVKTAQSQHKAPSFVYEYSSLMIVSGIKGLRGWRRGLVLRWPCGSIQTIISAFIQHVKSWCMVAVAYAVLCSFIRVSKLVSGCYIYEIGPEWGRGWTQGVGPPHRTVKAFSLPCHCRSEGVSTLASFILGTFTSILDNRTEQHRPAGRKRSNGTSFPQDVAWPMRRSKGEKVNQCTVKRNKRHNVMSN